MLDRLNRMVRRILKINIVLFIAEFKWLVALQWLAFWGLMNELAIKLTMLNYNSAIIRERRCSRHKICLRIQTWVSFILFEEMLWLTIEILLWFNFLASVAFYSPIEVVVLALRTDPAPIWKIKLRFPLIYRCLMLSLRYKVWVIVLNCIYQLLVLIRLDIRTRLQELLLLWLAPLYNLFTVSQPVGVPLNQILFMIVLLLIWTLSFEGGHVQIVFLELILRAVLVQHHLELLNLLKTTLSHYWWQLSQIRHVIGIHREDLSLGRGLSIGLSSLLGVGIGL